MVWPVGELQLFYEVTCSCLLREREGKRVREREKEEEKEVGEREERFINILY